MSCGNEPLKPLLSSPSRLQKEKKLLYDMCKYIYHKLRIDKTSHLPFSQYHKLRIDKTSHLPFSQLITLELHGKAL